jgi:hypothetical protein
VFTRLVAIGHPGDVSTGIAYATVQSAHDVDVYAMDVATAHLKAKFTHAVIQAMPHINPGFDIKVRPTGGPSLYVEVNGTQSAVPPFFMTGGERTFATANSGQYTLIMVFAIDLLMKTHSTKEYSGDPGAHFVFVPTQWVGLVKEA